MKKLNIIVINNSFVIGREKREGKIERVTQKIRRKGKNTDLPLIKGNTQKKLYLHAPMYRVDIKRHSE